MPIIEQDADEWFEESDKNYLQFFCLYFKMQISYLKMMAFRPVEKSYQKNAENQLVESLTLTNHLLTQLISRNYLISSYCERDSLFTIFESIEELESLILEFEYYLAKYKFISRIHKEQCERLISEISRFFYQNYVKVIIVDKKLSKPWLAPNLLTN